MSPSEQRHADSPGVCLFVLLPHENPSAHMRIRIIVRFIVSPCCLLSLRDPSCPGPVVDGTDVDGAFSPLFRDTRHSAWRSRLRRNPLSQGRCAAAEPRPCHAGSIDAVRPGTQIGRSCRVRDSSLRSPCEAQVRVIHKLAELGEVPRAERPDRAYDTVIFRHDVHASSPHGPGPEALKIMKLIR